MSAGAAQNQPHTYPPTNPLAYPPNFGVVAPTLLSFSDYSEQLLIGERVHLNDDPNLIFCDNNLIFGDNNLIFCDSLRPHLGLLPGT